MAWPIFRGLFDDASLFPPASLPMADAVAGHLRHQAAWYHEMSGPFVCADTKITELSAALTAADVAELDLALVLPGGAAALDAVSATCATPTRSGSPPVQMMARSTAPRGSSREPRRSRTPSRVARRRPPYSATCLLARVPPCRT
jgi:hypothetical protein